MNADQHGSETQGQHRVRVVMERIQKELMRAVRIHAAFHSAHEGYAILLEEVDELKAEVFRRDRHYDRMRTEAIHVAAMGARFVLDLYGEELDREL